MRPDSGAEARGGRRPAASHGGRGRALPRAKDLGGNVRPGPAEEVELPPGPARDPGSQGRSPWPRTFLRPAREGAPSLTGTLREGRGRKAQVRESRPQGAEETGLI